MKQLSLFLRKRLAPPIRRTLRLARHAVTPPRTSKWIPPELFADCRMCASRTDLVRRLPAGGQVAEVGTDTGVFAIHILDACAPAALHLIDLVMSKANAALAADSRVTMHRGLSAETLCRFQDDKFDWIYIDADHSYRGVSRDAAAAAPKVKPGGYLVFNDFAHADPFLGAYGVHRAVVDFVLRERWPFRWFAFEPSGLYDVALQRPELGGSRPLPPSRPDATKP